MSNIFLRQSKLDDLPSIVQIINDAKESLQERGIDQWQQGYPNEEVLKQDIQENISYALILDSEVVGVATLQQGYDKNFQEMLSGSWSDESEVTYSTIHRLSIAADHRGEHLCTVMIQQLLTISYYLGYKDVRTDTHPDNLALQHIVTENGFNEKGTIKMDEDQDVRKAYQIILK